METTESLSVESFSYSWLVNLEPSFESPKGSFRLSLDEFDESNFIVMDPKLSASQRFLVFHQDFDFDLPTLQPCVHADELISNGILVPLFLKPLDIEIYDPDSDSDSNSNSTLSLTMSSNILEKPNSFRRSRSISFRRYKRLPKRVLQKYLRLLRLFWLKMRTGRCDSIEVNRTKKWESCGSDNWTNEACGVDDWRRSCDSESSIYEAVLHCKKNIGNKIG